MPIRTYSLRRTKTVFCHCGRKLKIPYIPLLKTHIHCKKCKLEWHCRDGYIYSHPYHPKVIKRTFKKEPNIQGKIDTRGYLTSSKKSD